MKQHANFRTTLALGALALALGITSACGGKPAATPEASSTPTFVPSPSATIAASKTPNPIEIGADRMADIAEWLSGYCGKVFPINNEGELYSKPVERPQMIYDYFRLGLSQDTKAELADIIGLDLADVVNATGNMLYVKPGDNSLYTVEDIVLNLEFGSPEQLMAARQAIPEIADVLFVNASPGDNTYGDRSLLIDISSSKIAEKIKPLLDRDAYELEYGGFGQIHDDPLGNWTYSPTYYSSERMCALANFLIYFAPDYEKSAAWWYNFGTADRMEVEFYNTEGMGENNQPAYYQRADVILQKNDFLSGGHSEYVMDVSGSEPVARLREILGLPPSESTK